MRPGFSYRHLNLALLLGAAQSSAVCAAEPIYLRPGQCILVGSQQVCALQTDSTTVTELNKPQILYSCQYGVHKGSEVPDLKSYALYQARVTDSGKVETLLKNYGMGDKDKEACDKEVERREAAEAARK